MLSRPPTQLAAFTAVLCAASLSLSVVSLLRPQRWLSEVTERLWVSVDRRTGSVQRPPHQPLQTTRTS